MKGGAQEEPIILREAALAGVHVAIPREGLHPKRTWSLA